MIKRFLILSVMAVFILGLFLVPQPLMAATPDMEALSKKLYFEADLAFKNKELEKANDLLTQSLLANPANADAFFLKGHLSNLNEDPAEGLRLISRGLNINPKDLTALLWAGEAAVTLEDFEEADIHLKRLEKLCGDCAEQQTLLSMIEDADPQDKVASDKSKQSEE
jgi:tetratricopeptide (TPR) repeat protein